MYYYVLGCFITCLVLVAIDSMDTVCVKPAEIIVKAALWPVTVLEAIFRAVSSASSNHNFKAAL